MDQHQQLVSPATETQLSNALPPKGSRIRFDFPDNLTVKTLAMAEFVKRHRGSVIIMQPALPTQDL